MAASNVVTNVPYFSGTSAGTTWVSSPVTISGGMIQGNISATDIRIGKPAPRYWWKYTHYECPLCGSVDVVRERVNVADQAKPEDPDDRHTDVVIACGYHFT